MNERHDSDRSRDQKYFRSRLGPKCFLANEFCGILGAFNEQLNNRK